MDQVEIILALANEWFTDAVTAAMGKTSLPEHTRALQEANIAASDLTAADERMQEAAKKIGL